MALAASLSTLSASGRPALQDMSIRGVIMATVRLDLFAQRAVKNDFFMNIYRCGGMVGLVFQSVNVISVQRSGHGTYVKALTATARSVSSANVAYDRPPERAIPKAGA
jgi:hypothetical protein